MFSERNKLVIMVKRKRHTIVIVGNNITDGIVHQAEAEQPGVKCARQIKRVKRGGCRKARHHDRRLDRPWYDERPDRTYAARGRGKGSPHAGKLSAIPSSV